MTSFRFYFFILPHFNHFGNEASWWWRRRWRWWWPTKSYVVERLFCCRHHLTSLFFVMVSDDGNGEKRSKVQAACTLDESNHWSWIIVDRARGWPALCKLGVVGSLHNVSTDSWFASEFTSNLCSCGVHATRLLMHYLQNDRHERLVKLSRDVTIASKRVIFVLQRYAQVASSSHHEHERTSQYMNIPNSS